MKKRFISLLQCIGCMSASQQQNVMRSLAVCLCVPVACDKAYYYILKLETWMKEKKSVESQKSKIEDL